MCGDHSSTDENVPRNRRTSTKKTYVSIFRPGIKNILGLILLGKRESIYKTIKKVNLSFNGKIKKEKIFYLATAKLSITEIPSLPGVYTKT